MAGMTRTVRWPRSARSRPEVPGPEREVQPRARHPRPAVGLNEPTVYLTSASAGNRPPSHPRVACQSLGSHAFVGWNCEVTA